LRSARTAVGADAAVPAHARGTATAANVGVRATSARRGDAAASVRLRTALAGEVGACLRRALAAARDGALARPAAAAELGPVASAAVDRGATAVTLEAAVHSLSPVVSARLWNARAAVDGRRARDDALRRLPGRSALLARTAARAREDAAAAVA